jgi:hypothetical protein
MTQSRIRRAEARRSEWRALEVQAPQGVINTAHCNAYREVEQRLREGSDHFSLATQSLNELQRA